MTRSSKLLIARVLVFSLGLVSISLILFTSLTASAQPTQIVHGFKSDKELNPQTLVSIAGNDTSKVEAASLSNLPKLYGVVIDPSDAPIILNSESGQNTYVASSGRYPVLVSDENGVVKAGDYLSVSATPGIAAKVREDEGLVLGKATTSFDAKKGVITKTKSGISIGRVTVDINIIKNPGFISAISKSKGILHLAESVAGKKVNPIRLYAAIAALIVIIFIVSNLLYGGVRSSIIAIGRNPLSRPSVMRSLIQVIFLCMAILALGLGGVYLLLKL